MNQKCSVLRTDLWNLQHGLCHWQTGAMLRGCWVKLWRESYGNRMKTKRMMLIFRARAWKEFLRKNGFSTYLRCHLVLRIGVVYEIVKLLLYFSKDELGEERQQHKWCFQQLSHEPYRGWLRRYDIRELKKKSFFHLLLANFMGKHANEMESRDQFGSGYERWFASRVKLNIPRAKETLFSAFGHSRRHMCKVITAKFRSLWRILRLEQHG